MATTRLFTRPEFLEFGRPYDFEVLEALRARSRVTMLHVCGTDLMFDAVADYPVDVLNWAAGTSGTSLADARRLTDAHSPATIASYVAVWAELGFVIAEASRPSPRQAADSSWRRPSSRDHRPTPTCRGPPPVEETGRGGGLG
jgi:hypothetical protein